MIRTGEPSGIRPSPQAELIAGERRGARLRLLHGRLRELHGELLGHGKELPRGLRTSLVNLVDGVEGLLTAHQSLETEVVRLRGELRRANWLARQDTLSGLPNRLHFDEVAAREFEQARRGGHPLHVSVLDLDHFKRCNDTYGHVVGDMVLQRTGLVLQRVIRNRVFAARMGGEEFAILLPGMETSPVIELVDS